MTSTVLLCDYNLAKVACHLPHHPLNPVPLLQIHRFYCELRNVRYIGVCKVHGGICSVCTNMMVHPFTWWGTFQYKFYSYSGSNQLNS